MKLHEVFKSPEDQKLDYWLHREVQFSEFDSFENMKLYAVNGVISCVELDENAGYGMELQFQCLSENKHWNPPTSDVDKAFMHVDTLSLSHYVLDDFTKIPKSIVSLHLNKNDIKSIDGIAKLHVLDAFDLTDKIFENSKPFGLLSLLKAPKLKHFTVIPGTPQENKWTKMGDIIDKYLKGSRDIADCQEELIDAGLEEWAKL